MANQRGLIATIGRYGGVLDDLMRHRRWVRWTFSGVAIAAASVSLVGRAQTFREAPTPRLSVPPAVVHPQADTDTIVAAHLFGVDESSGPLGALARSALNLVVTGLLATGESGGMVVISVDGQAETAFAAGDEILPGVRLHAVEAERIIIARAGRLETVPLKELPQIGGTALVLASANETSLPYGGVTPTVVGANELTSPSRPSPRRSQSRRLARLAEDSRAPQGATAVSTVDGAPAATRLHGNPQTGSGATVAETASDSMQLPPGADSSKAPATSNSTVPGPSPEAAGAEVPRPKAGEPAPEVPRPAPGTPVPQVPRPAPGVSVDGPPRPAK
jgi:hypothetical protein